MKALIFAAGLGTRLQPLTDTIPKALVPVGNTPLLEIVIRKLKAAGVDQIMINIHHFADQIIDFVRSKDNFQIRIEFSDERDQLLDTGGGIKKASWFFDNNEPFFVHNVDILSDINLKKLYQDHIQNNALATLFVSHRKTIRYLLFNKDNRLVAWINTSTGEIKPQQPCPESIDSLQKMAFNGIHVISPKIFNYMDNWNGKFSIIDFYLSVASQININAYTYPDVKMLDVGKIDSLNEARIFIQEHYM